MFFMPNFIFSANFKVDVLASYTFSYQQQKDNRTGLSVKLLLSVCPIVLLIQLLEHRENGRAATQSSGFTVEISCCTVSCPRAPETTNTAF